jgi:hypothetical protein
MANAQNQKWDIYVSGALSDLTPEQYTWVTTEIYDRVARVCEGAGLRCYCPHRFQTTSAENMLYGKAWKADYERVVNARAVIAYLGIPAFEVGAVTEMARTANIPVILLCETPKHEKLSKFMLENSTVIDILSFNQPSEFEEPLRKPLFYVFSKRSLADAATEEVWPSHLRRRLERTLEDSLNASAFRKFPAMPITKEEWKKKAAVNGQTALFEEVSPSEFDAGQWEPPDAF